MSDLARRMRRRHLSPRSIVNCSLSCSLKEPPAITSKGNAPTRSARNLHAKAGQSSTTNRGCIDQGTEGVELQ